ncbi:hypothetical protein SLA_2455 [Streptomyces laurentii]|uniref:Translation initiation factor 2 n=1 Tax=Streptomyces laurentii TaxID=39478 RepID=A0A169NET2_STRLU|nr:hypothetical protein SLA_2455 [Streptomyces laurentii]
MEPVTPAVPAITANPVARVLTPVGPDAARWRTFDGERTLVVAARTVTSLVRALDVVPEITHDDPRVTVVFAYDPTSAFNDGVLDLLRDLGCRTLPWPQLAEITPDLLLSASENIKVPPGDYPVLVLPHGVGFHKRVPDSEGPGTRLSGLVPEELLAARRAWLAVSHPDQAAQLAAAHPGTAGRTVLVGDPVLDRLLASARRRERYRAALGVPPRQRLVLVSSTWGGESLAGTRPGLPAELLAELPADEFRVALVLHPNVWSAHGAWQIRVMQRSAVEAGLIVVDPTDGWQQALVAADLVIGDHGSVTLYGAATGHPVLLGAFGSESVPGTAGHALRSAAGWLDDDGGPLRPRVEAALTGTGHAPRLAEVAARAFAEPGTALPRLRELVYELLRLAPPKRLPARGPRAFPLPPPHTARARSLLVRTTVVRDDGTAGELHVHVDRFPAGLATDPAEDDHRYWHLACDVDEPDTRLTESATVVSAASGVCAPGAAAEGVARLLADFPGARIAALPREADCLVGLRDGRTVRVAAPDGAALTDPGTAAAAVYACLRAGVPPYGTTLVLHHGPHQRRRLELEPGPREPAPATGPGRQPVASRSRTAAARGLPPSS